MFSILGEIPDDMVRYLILIIGVIFVFYKLFISINYALFLKRIKVYGLTKEFLCDMCNKETHNLIIEKGFLALTGMLCSVKEIKFLLSFESPIFAIEQRISSSCFLKFDDSKNFYIWDSFFKKKFFQKIGPTFFFNSLYYCIIDFYLHDNL